MLDEKYSQSERTGHVRLIAWVGELRRIAARDRDSEVISFFHTTALCYDEWESPQGGIEPCE